MIHGQDIDSESAEWSKNKQGQIKTVRARQEIRS